MSNDKAKALFKEYVQLEEVLRNENLTEEQTFNIFDRLDELDEMLTICYGCGESCLQETASPGMTDEGYMDFCPECVAAKRH